MPTYFRSFFRPRFLAAVLVGAMSSLIGEAQTNHAAQTLPFALTAQSGSTLPAGVAVHKFGAIPTTRTTAAGTADLPYNATANSGGWQDEAANGIGLLASSSNQVGALVVAINTTGKTAIQVSWVCHTIFQQASRDNSVALQYRVGTSGNFTDVGTTSTYTSLNKTAIDTSPTFIETLPADAENQPVVQVRWIYWESNGSAGSRDRIAIDDVAITASSFGSTNPSAVVSASALAPQPGQNVLLTVTVTPGTNPASSGLAVTGDLSAIGGSSSSIVSKSACRASNSSYCCLYVSS